MPVLAPTTAAGLPQSAFSPFGRDAQSRAFLRTPGMEELYSGDAIRTASAVSIALRSRRAPAGPAPASSSWSEGSTSFSPPKSSTAPDGGRSSAAVRSSATLCEPRRRLPEIARSFIYLLLHQLEVDGEGHLVAEDLRAVRELHVPVEAVVVAIDDGLELDADPVLAIGSRHRSVDLAAGDDRLGDPLHGQLTVDEQVTIVERHLVGLEGDLRRLVSVEELRGEEVSFEVLLLHLDALDRNVPGELRLPRLVAERRLELAEAAAECADSVPDGESHARMNGIGLPGAGRNG